MMPTERRVYRTAATLSHPIPSLRTNEKNIREFILKGYFAILK